MAYRGGLGILTKLRRLVRPRAANFKDLKGAYVRHVQRETARGPVAEAMALAVGGPHFDYIGGIEAALLRHYGLEDDGYLIDVGCGSGRLAKPLSEVHLGPYLGTDVVPALLDHARTIVNRPDWRFEEVDHIGIPEKDGRADMVCFFSVLTHLLHEQSYWYLQEARRVLKPGGRIVLSVIEFSNPNHWEIFEQTVLGARQGSDYPLNVYIERSVLPVWAAHLDMEVEDLRAGEDVIVPEGFLGQALCVLRKPL